MHQCSNPTQEFAKRVGDRCIKTTPQTFQSNWVIEELPDGTPDNYKDIIDPLDIAISTLAVGQDGWVFDFDATRHVTKS